MFSHIGVLIALRCYSLQMENLDHVITIVKIWVDDSQMNCAQYKDMKDFMIVETSLTKNNYDLFEKTYFF